MEEGEDPPRLSEAFMLRKIKQLNNLRDFKEYSLSSDVLEVNSLELLYHPWYHSSYWTLMHVLSALSHTSGHADKPFRHLSKQSGSPYSNKSQQSHKIHKIHKKSAIIPGHSSFDEWACGKRWVFRKNLKVVMEVACWMYWGREFQRKEAAWLKSLDPTVVRLAAGRTSWMEEEDLIEGQDCWSWATIGFSTFRIYLKSYYICINQVLVH